MKDLSKEILAYSLQNALEFGKADVGKILPKLFQHGLQKSEIKRVMPLIQESVKEVNGMSEKERKSAFGKLSNKVKKREIKEKSLPELNNVSLKKKPVFRMAPFPSGAIHLGNAKTFLINALYAEKYNGKLLLVIDDTIGSAEKQIDKESYKLIEKAFKFLDIKYDKPIIYKSDRLPIYYKYAEELIKKGKAYVDYSSREDMREMRAKGQESGDRQFSPEIQMKRWEEMFKVKEGHAVLRLKTSMQHKNPAFRDRVLFKVSDRKHPRKGNKYRVWPSLEMSWAVDDHLLGITHIIRGNDLLMETEMEKYIWDIFKWKHPEVIHTGLINIEGVKVSKSKSQKEVKSGKYSGWDDPRTWSIQSLERRGITKEAIREFVEGIGLNKQDITVPIETLYSINRGLLDAKAERYSFVEKPIELNIKNPLKIKEVSVPIHPESKKKRVVKVGKIFVSKRDFVKFKNKEVRLLHLYNIKLGKTSEVTSIENKKIQKLNWVSKGVKVNVLMPDGNTVEGLAEDGIEKLKKNQVVQFERFGFVKYDGKSKNLHDFWFAHK